MGNARLTDSPDISLRTLRGLDERTSPANLTPGTFDILRGFYPGKTGLLQRIPPHDYLLDGNGNPIWFAGRVLGLHDTGNANGDILIQTTSGLYATTLDELLNRQTTPSLTPTVQTEEESMSCAIIVQQEANNVGGGSVSGFISGTDTTSAINTFYGRRLTDLLVNENDYATGLVPTVSAFAAATGGANAVSTPGTFTLTPGTYRVTGRFSFSSATKFRIGLWNSTTSLFEVYSGTSVPIMAANTGGTSDSGVATLDAVVVVASTNKTFQFNQECLSVGASAGRVLTACGLNYGTGATVNSAQPKETYAHIKILRTA